MKEKEIAIKMNEQNDVLLCAQHKVAWKIRAQLNARYVVKTDVLENQRQNQMATGKLGNGKM